MNGTKPPQAAAAPDLTTLVASVLGNLAFLCSDDAPPPLATGASSLEAEVRYTGAASGRLRCWCTRSLAEKLAANLLALEPDDDEAQRGAEDALREFLNVLCGQLVTAWHDPRGVFNLSIPVVRPCYAAPAATEAVAQHLCRLYVEGELLVCAYEGGH